MSDDDSAQRDRDRKAADLRQSRAPLSRVAGEMIGMAPWKKKMLAGFLFIAAVGSVLWVAGWVSARNAVPEIRPGVRAPAATDANGPSATDDPQILTLPDGAPGSSFVDRRQTRSAPDDAASTAPPSDASAPPADGEDVGEAGNGLEMPWTGHVGRWMARLGLSFAGGLVLGIFFRTFLKTMAAITAIVVTLLVGLSYFELINIDFTTMRTNYDSFAAWLSDQGWRVREMLTGVLPSAIFAGLGFFVGFLRR